MNLMNRERRGGVGRAAGGAITLALAMLLAACGGKGDKNTQAAARVNKEEITVHQINFVLQRQPNLKPEQTEASAKQALERLIDQELAVQKAEDMKLDRDPRVVQQIEAAKQEIIARAYVERVGEAAPAPSAEEISKYYDEKPALFKERRIYSLQELLIDATADQIPGLRDKLRSAKTAAEFAEYLKANDFRFAANQAVRAAEQLPLASLDSIARMHDGDSAVMQTPTGLQVLFLQGSRSQPVDLDRARSAIEKFLLNQRKAELVRKDLKKLREAAKIEYVGKFSEGATAAAKGGAVSASAPAAASAAASELDGNAMTKGLGLK